MDWIHIKGIEANCIVGDLDWERTTKQPIRCDLAVACDMSAVVASDELQDTIDYVALTASVVETLTTTKFQMIEKLADQVANNILTQFPCSQVKLTLHKQAHFPHASGVAISVERAK